jgi:trehalose 6-phosphate synthase/phosphatase
VKELTDHLVHFTANLDVQVIQGNKVIEMRNSGIDKGIAAMFFVSRKKYDFVLAIGDDWTDEDLFRAVGASAYSIKVGDAPSHAEYNLRGPRDVLDLITRIKEAALSKITQAG